jgi:hypothetical protein
MNAFSNDAYLEDKVYARSEIYMLQKREQRPSRKLHVESFLLMVH